MSLLRHGRGHYVLSRSRRYAIGGALISGPETTPLPNADRGPTGRRSRVLIAALVTWALLASIGFGWMWTADQGHQASIRATTNLIVFDMGFEFLSASAATRSLLLDQDLSDGWNASIWLDEVYSRVGELSVTNDGLAVLHALNLTGEVPHCSSRAYVNILARAAFNDSLLNGTNPYTLYFGVAENLTLSLGHDLWNITGSSSNAPVQLGSPSVTAIRAELAALYAASKSYGAEACPHRG